ncbi:MCE family protein [Mycobacterium sp. URHB0044]|uniref:MCE family protein n=1 Tax=Mycobacterium sp. URHB0044 TaxID=1380386 RepID=UPI00049156E2|nr:MCE family protein [Mycobacterium sp. URHB0044]
MRLPGIDVQRRPPYRTVGAASLVLVMVAAALVWLQFRGVLASTTRVTLLTSRAGLMMDPGSKVTYNGVQIGRVAAVDQISDGTVRGARLTLAVDPRYLELIPVNVDAHITASTIFGAKYVSLSAPTAPAPQRLKDLDVIDVSSVTTEVDTLFETITSISEKVDPVKLNQTLSATAQALDGLGHHFGQSILDGNDILAELNPQMPQIRYDIHRLADVDDEYAKAAPDLFAGLQNAVSTARTLNDQRGNLDHALMAAIGFGATAGDLVERSGPYLVRGAADSVATSGLLDEYSPEIFCTIRNYHDVAPKVAAASGGNGYSGIARVELVGAGNPYVYPDNLPRINARGGPEGRPGCWQPVTRDLWPAPYLVMDTGASIAPYNHLGLGQPILIDYVWGRQVGENTINP